MEMFEAFGFAERVLKEAYWVNETVFWGPDEGRADIIVRRDRIQDTEDGLSEFPHVILNQARVHDFFLDVMRKSPMRLEPDYGRTLVDLKLDGDASAVYLEVENDGRTRLVVTSGVVELSSKHAERVSIVVAGSQAMSEKGKPPGIPHHHEASLAMREALDRMDVDAILAEAGPDDAVSLWHLFFRVDEQDREVEVGEAGELLVRTPTMMRGYWGRPGLNARAFYHRPHSAGFDDVFHRTGDLVRERADGALDFLGRKDRQIKTRGYRVELDEVEAALASHPHTESAAVYPVPDEEGSQRIHAAVKLSPFYK